MREPKKAILLREHSADCRAIHPRNWPDNPLWYPQTELEYRDSIGRNLRNGASGHAYILFECNDTRCKAAVLVIYSEVTKLAHRLMVEALKGGRG